MNYIKYTSGYEDCLWKGMGRWGNFNPIQPKSKPTLLTLLLEVNNINRITQLIEDKGNYNANYSGEGLLK